MAVLPAGRAALLRPLGGRCERCGHNRAVHAHHRWRRGQGGPDDPANLAALCHICHNWVHGHVAMAKQGGWLLIPGTEPATAPVTLWSGERVLLTSDGSYQYAL